jgi:hypothetical protein
MPNRPSEALSEANELMIERCDQRFVIPARSKSLAYSRGLSRQ